MDRSTSLVVALASLVTLAGLASARADDVFKVDAAKVDAARKILDARAPAIAEQLAGMPEGVRAGVVVQDVQGNKLFDVDCSRLGCVNLRDP